MTATASTPAQRGENAPLDLVTMRKSAASTLETGAALPRYDDLQDTFLVLRGHLNLLVPEVEDLARALPDGHTAHALARTALVNARTLMSCGPGPGLVSGANHARALARDLRTLCDQYETLHSAHLEQPG